MLIVMSRQATGTQVQQIANWVESVGYRARVATNEGRTIIGVLGDDPAMGPLGETARERFGGVERIVGRAKPYPLASLEARDCRSVIRVGSLGIGGGGLVVMAGPCSVESEEQLMEAAYLVKKAGAQVLRGGAFKPRPHPTASRGWGRRA